MGGLEAHHRPTRGQSGDHRDDRQDDGQVTGGGREQLARAIGNRSAWPGMCQRGRVTHRLAGTFDQHARVCRERPPSLRRELTAQLVALRLPPVPCLDRPRASVELVEPCL